MMARIVISESDIWAGIKQLDGTGIPNSWLRRELLNRIRDGLETGEELVGLGDGLWMLVKPFEVKAGRLGGATHQVLILVRERDTDVARIEVL